jgi:tetratricopeptide (TPR) repeat protein
MKTPIALSLAIAFSLFCNAVAADPVANSAKLKRATQLVDDYFGDRRDLDEAAVLVSQILAKDKHSAEAFVQAARITIKGGYIVGDEYEPEAEQLTEKFVNRALQIDPRNITALSLKAEQYIGQKDLPKALSTLQLGLSINPNYPWLHLDFAWYYRTKREFDMANREYQFVIDRGPNGDSDQTRCYPRAITSMAEVFAGIQGEGKISEIREWAVIVDNTRSPKDAWILDRFAEIFAEKGYFDDALVYSRKALSVMDFGVGRRTLAMTLYGKSAQLSNQGKDYSALLNEAKSMNFSRADIALWFEDTEPNVSMLLPIVLKLLPEEVPAKVRLDLPAT